MAKPHCRSPNSPQGFYVFDYEPLKRGNQEAVPADEVVRAVELGQGSWAKQRKPGLRMHGPGIPYKCDYP